MMIIFGKMCFYEEYGHFGGFGAVALAMRGWGTISR
jgi:hypothetical protein